MQHENDILKHASVSKFVYETHNLQDHFTLYLNTLSDV
jgi:hypothetical protein